MDFELGEVVLKEGAPVEVKVRFWDETKPVPQDIIEATIFLRTDETNIFILKTMALIEAQKLMAHITGTVLGRGDELLNDFILIYESPRGIAGLESPVSWPFPPTIYDEIPQHVLDWREGDEITSEHRNILAARIARTFNVSSEKEEKTRLDYAHIPDTNIADGLAVLIATVTGMDVETFKRTFPTIARNSQSLTVKMFLTLHK
jgi:hypothetical protein